jgi:hypothetical protein
MPKAPATTYRKLRRPEAQMLANWVRAQKLMELPNGWLTFYRLSPEEIHRRFSVLDVPAIVREARIQAEQPRKIPVRAQ